MEKHWFSPAKTTAFFSHSKTEATKSDFGRRISRNREFKCFQAKVFFLHKFQKSWTKAWNWIFYRCSCYWTCCGSLLNRRTLVQFNSTAIFDVFTVMDSIFFFLQTYKDFKVQRSIDCQPKNETYPVKVTNMTGMCVNETINFNGKIEILEDLPTKIEVEASLTRCNLDSSGCSFFDKMIISKICEKMQTKTSISYKIAQGIRPIPTCPIVKNSYEMIDSKISLDMFKLLPLEGFLWRCRYIFYEKNGPKRVRPLACVEYEVAVVTKVRRPKPKH